jgi:DNA invertase Pin-like site-specific DNA recombinase
MRVAIYTRVSTDSQTTDNQIRDLHEVGRRLGWAVVETYTDHGISGAKGRDHRPAFDSLMKAVNRRDIDLVAAWSVDRLSRSLGDLIGFMEELRNRDIGLFLHQQNLDTTTPAGRAMFGMLGIFAEFERATIRSRVVAGIERARAQGKRLGRPPIQPYRVRDIQTHLANGMSIRDTAKIVGCSVGTVHRVKNARRDEHQ